MIIGAIHQLVGSLAGLGLIEMPGAAGRKPLWEIVSAGVFNAVEPDLARSSMVWFLLFGFVLLMLGSLIRRLEQQHTPLPRALGMQLFLLALSGVVLMPLSGFWLALPLGVRLWRKGVR